MKTYEILTSYDLIRHYKGRNYIDSPKIQVCKRNVGLLNGK